MAFQVACRAGQRHRGFKTYCERDIDDGADTDGEQAAPAQDELDYDGGGDADEGGNRRSGESQEAAPTSRPRRGCRLATAHPAADDSHPILGNLGLELPPVVPSEAFQRQLVMSSNRRPDDRCVRLAHVSPARGARTRERPALLLPVLGACLKRLGRPVYCRAREP
jgi:hypothetical protein